MGFLITQEKVANKRITDTKGKGTEVGHMFGMQKVSWVYIRAPPISLQVEIDVKDQNTESCCQPELTVLL